MPRRRHCRTWASSWARSSSVTATPRRMRMTRPHTWALAHRGMSHGTMIRRTGLKAVLGVNLEFSGLRHCLPGDPGRGKNKKAGRPGLRPARKPPWVNDYQNPALVLGTLTLWEPVLKEVPNPVTLFWVRRLGHAAPDISIPTASALIEFPIMLPPPADMLDV
jgi:hypothetical protein